MKKPVYAVGQVLNAVGVSLDIAHTKPPARYTEDSLLEDMLSAYKFATNANDRELLKLITGIGTSRTRGTIIKNFVDRGFLLRKKVDKLYQLRVSPEGKALLMALPDAIKDVALTAKWERALGMVRNGDAKPEQLFDKVSIMLQDLMGRLLATSPTGAGNSNRK